MARRQCPWLVRTSNERSLSELHIESVLGCPSRAASSPPLRTGRMKQAVSIFMSRGGQRRRALLAKPGRARLASGWQGRAGRSVTTLDVEVTAVKRA